MINKNIRKLYAALAASFFTFTLIGFTNMASVGTIHGKIEGLIMEDDSYYLYGYVCQKNISNSLGLHYYLGGEAGKGGVHAFRGDAEFVAEDSIAAECGSAMGAKLRFKTKIPDSVLQNYAGKSIYVHGLRAIAGVPNALLIDSGNYKLPPSLSVNARGCLPSSINVPDTRNTYMSEYLQPQNSPWIYTAWVWRETPDAGTNHSLSVARTKDMVNWENTCGQKLTLPITSNSLTVIDPLLPFSGLMNNVKLGFDSKGQPIVSYQKNKFIFSKTAAPVVATQVYNARLEGNTWKVYQMTNWTTKSNQVGGGSLGSGDFTPGFSAVGIDRNGVMFQTLKRPNADTVGLPATGVWVISDVDGQLTLTDKIYDPASAPVDSFSPKSGIAGLKYTLKVRDADWQTKFSQRPQRTIAEEQWQVLRGDWNGRGKISGAVFNRKTRQFVIREEEKDNRFHFGPGQFQTWPLIGDWNKDGKDSIGVYDSVNKKIYVRNTLDAGNQERINYPHDIKDGHANKHYQINPSLTYILMYEQLPANNDLPFNCQGVPYRENNAEAQVARVNVVNSCPEKFLSPLNLNIYNMATKKWDTFPIEDEVWGVGGAFAIKVMRGYQIMAYYDKFRNVKIAIRDPNGEIKYQVLDKVFDGWDSHNYLTLTVDENLDIHLAGDQHVNPLNYWRSEGLNANFKRYAQTEVAEKLVTYPTFFRSPKGELLFQYRDGSSGNGDWIINKYNIRTKVWTRLLKTNIFGKN